MKIYNFIIKVLTILKGDTVAGIGKFITFLGTINFVITIDFNSDGGIQAVVAPEVSLFNSGLVIIGVVILVVRSITLLKKHTSLFYGIGMKNMSITSPIASIPFYLRPSTEPILLKVDDSYDKQNVIDFYNRYHQIVHDRAFNSHVVKNYIAALGSFPYLFLIGSMFRDAYAEKLSILDFNRTKENGTWFELPEYKENNLLMTHKLIYSDSTIDEEISRLQQYNEVAIALAYTFEISQENINPNIRDKTLFLTSSYGLGHDKLSDIESQSSLLKELSYYISSLSGGTKKVHLFVSAQSSMCINIGRLYMNNAHGNLLLHNYDHLSSSYNWSIEFSNGKIVK